MHHYYYVTNKNINSVVNVLDSLLHFFIITIGVNIIGESEWT